MASWADQITRKETVILTLFTMFGTCGLFENLKASILKFHGWIRFQPKINRAVHFLSKMLSVSPGEWVENSNMVEKSWCMKQWLKVSNPIVLYLLCKNKQ